MPQHDRTPDVEHLFFSDLPPLEPIHESESAQPLGPLAIYMGCHPAAGRSLRSRGGARRGAGDDGRLARGRLAGADAQRAAGRVVDVSFALARP